MFEMLTASLLRRVNVHHNAKFRADRSNPVEEIWPFFIFEMADVRHIGFDFSVFQQPIRVFIGLRQCAKFRCNRCSSFDNMLVLLYCEFGLKMPIHAPFWVVLGVFDPIDGTIFAGHNGPSDVLLFSHP